ncbi:regulator of chromosome condensation [Anaeramoeba flamelloides]|uniref:Regulator of chromosome condensation n=1 Tax=Anaeramoeba flamelloides TaxID=1746091 RepID=A0ABQ8Z2T7_9EUKA|nr:regulator of chromosome condensation [Anaeramoeba flamelloides]
MSNIKYLGYLNEETKKTKKFETLDPIKTFPEEVTKIVGVADTEDDIVFLSSEGKLYPTSKRWSHEKLKAIENLPPMKSIASGDFHFIVLSNEEKPRVYGWGQNVLGQVGFDNNSNDYEVRKPTLIEPLKEKNIDQIFCGSFCSFFLNKTTNVLFGCGDTTDGCLGKQGFIEGYTYLQKLHENVANVFCGPSYHTFMTKTDGKLYGFGHNYSGNLF